MQPIRFKLLVDKTDQDGRAPVFLIYNYNGHQFRFFTKEKCDPKHWDANRMRFRKSLPGSQEANEYLESLEDRLRKAYRDYMGQGIVPTPSMLKSELLPAPGTG